MKINVTDVKVTGGKVELITELFTPVNGKIYNIFLDYRKFATVLGTVTGNEPVGVKIDAQSPTNELETNAGNIFKGGKIAKKPFVYRCVYGNDGYSSTKKHFLCLNTPCGCACILPTVTP